MTISARLTLWYAGMLLCSLLLMGGVLHYELVTESERGPGIPRESPSEHIADVLVFYGVPTIVALVIGGSLLMRRALKPIQTLSATAERAHAGNLAERVPTSGHGDELDRLADVFNAMLDRVEEGVASVREFTIHASHELKTPLTILSLQAEGALIEASLSFDQRGLLESQLEEVRRLTTLVEALGVLASADTGLPVIAREPLRFDEVLRQAVEDVRPVAARHRITVELARCDTAPFEGDRAGLRQILLNLLDNAVKHNHADGWVSVELLAHREELALSIENSGPPIPPEIIPRIFDRFVSGASSKGGFGLGLSIAKTIVELHGGSIAFVDRPDGGARLAIHLPSLPPAPT